MMRLEDVERSGLVQAHRLTRITHRLLIKWR